MLIVGWMILCMYNAYALEKSTGDRMTQSAKKLEIVTTDLSDHSVLTTPAMDVTFPLPDEVKTVIKKMREYIISEEHEDGVFTVGLAAPQVGYPLRIFFYQIPAALAKKYEIEQVELSLLINTTYKPTKDSIEEKQWEGCLSVEDKMGEALRFSEIKYTGYKEDGSKETKIVSGLLAQIIQHETDHTYGILFTDKVPDDGSLVPINEAKAKKIKNQKIKH